MNSTSNILRIGFVDLLAGFLVASIALMIIIKYGTRQGSEVAAYPKDYILYTLEVSLPNTSSTLELDSILIQFMIKPPDSKWLKSKINKEGNVWSSTNGFIEFEGGDHSKNFYGIGPSYSKSRDTAYYHVYGLEKVKSNMQWKLGARYYSNLALENGNFKEDDLPNLIKEEISIRQKLEYLGSKQESTSDEISISLGEEVLKSIEYKKS